MVLGSSDITLHCIKKTRCHYLVTCSLSTGSRHLWNGKHTARTRKYILPLNEARVQLTNSNSIPKSILLLFNNGFNFTLSKY